MAGTNTFVNNTGYQGGAMAFYENSQMYLQNLTHITIMNNHARHVGGAVYVYDDPIDPIMAVTPNLDCGIHIYKFHTLM